MIKKLLALLNKPISRMLIGGVIMYLSFVAVILATIQIPPDAILDSGLQEVLLVFEE